MKIVIVEDEIRIREGIAGLIRKYSSQTHEIYEASCGEEGLIAIRKFFPDLVITDVRMEPMDGLEMLSILISQDHIEFKTIILSAYSEFEYAKQAISLGVDEYLVKPIDVTEFQAAIKRLEDEIMQERLIHHEISGGFNSLENILNSLLSKQIIYNQETAEYISKKYPIKYDSTCVMIYAYFENIDRGQYNSVLRALSMLRKQQKENAASLLPFPDDNAILLVFFNNLRDEQAESFCRQTIIREIKRLVSSPVVFVIDWFNGLELLHDSFENIKRNIHWNISLGDTIVSMKALQPKEEIAAPYPMQAERNSVSCISAEDYNGLREEILLFLRSFSGNSYTPDSIKKCCIRYFLTLLQIVKELNFTAYERINEQKVLRDISAAKTAGELETAMEGLLIGPSQKNEIKTGGLIKKVIRIVEEQYKSGIMLKEIANELGISPDHISVQFNRELGVNFSTYIKNYRIGKAKELLIGTNLKIFDIARRIGISDAQYFSRVFKEAEGIHPADYRKKYR